jgi:hypothetical protein
MHAIAGGREQIVRGKVTYVAAGTVYTSLGRESGVQDSTLQFVVAAKDTLAMLKTFAVSSKSSACMIVKSKRDVVLGDDVAAKVLVEERKVDSTAASLSPSSEPSQSGRTRRDILPARLNESMKAGGRLASLDSGFADVQGRVSAQYFTSLQSTADFNISQPGIAINLRGTMRDIPVKLDVYANLRTLSIGKQSPFSRSAINQSRIYGLSLTYDDLENVVSLGRIIPTFSPSIGYIDGALLSRKFGNVVFGVTVGFQPEYSLRAVSTGFKKFAAFAQFLSDDRISFSASAAYARTYFHSALDREAASVLLNAAITQDVFLYANTEVDLRKKSGEQFVLSPKLTSAYVNLNYRITSSFSIGLGADAARPYYSFESVRNVPDSLLYDELRSGVSLNVSWMLPGGISLYNTYTPRNSSEQSFGKEFSNYSSLNLNNLFESGLNFRVNANVNANQFTNGNGYGAALQKTFGSVVDVNVRYQTNTYTIKQLDARNRSVTVGGDVMVFLTSSLTFLATYDRLDGYGTISNSIFAEVSVRF